MPDVFVTAEEFEKGITVRTNERTRIVIVKPPIVARVLGKAFNTNRSQVLPGAARKMARLRNLLQQRAPTHLLIVGHCDTTGDDAVNDPLSLERAQNTLAFIRDDPEPWLEMYTAQSTRRWDRQEDMVMISSARGFSSKDSRQEAVRWFQETRGLKVDGDAGPETRRALITEYMSLDGDAFGDLAQSVDFTAHGCGEHFPLDDSGRRVEHGAPDGKEDAMDRRVEFFFFSRRTGVQPPPPGPNSGASDSQYPEWRRKSRLDFETVIVEGEDDLFIRLHLDPKTVGQRKEELRLFSVGGEYDATRSAADGEAGEGFVDVVFTRVPTALAYSLEVSPPAGTSYLLFEEVPFESLDGFVESAEGLERDPLEPEPGLDDDGAAA